MSFSQDLNRFVSKTEIQATRAVHKIMIAGFQGVQSRTPVDTGRARSNWNISRDAPDMTVTDGTDPVANMSTELVKISQFTFEDDELFITNNLPYANALEFGSSPLAPAGMVRVTSLELQAKIDAGQI